ncbi:MAG: hypothetical protein NZ770_09055, partial [Candidatus Poseidoniaceae archaeon]|nr:hypothetical protein [Candidatus Poseidoniaceae archaeon]
LNHLYIATDGGVARWNLTADDWDNPLTTMDGLASNNVNNLFMSFSLSGPGQTYSDDILYMSTPMGLARWDVPNDAPLSTLTRNQGLVGDNSRTLFFWSQSPTAGDLMVAHDGAGSTRPGVTQLSLGTTYGSTSPTGTIIDVHRPDQIPHNTVTAVATDWWGVHIATPADPITHWNASNNQFEDGAASWQTPSWPIFDMDSDGNDLWATGNGGAVRINAVGTTHQVRAAYPIEEARAVSVGSNGFWLVADSGLYGWEPAPTYGEMERFLIRRAIPLNVGFVGNYQNVSAYTHPGASFNFINAGSSITLDPSLGVPGPGGIRMQATALSLSSPVEGSATWVRSMGLTYSGTWDLNDTDPGLHSTL